MKKVENQKLKTKVKGYSKIKK